MLSWLLQKLFGWQLVPMGVLDEGYMLNAPQARWVQKMYRQGETERQRQGGRPRRSLSGGGARLAMSPSGGIAAGEGESCAILDDQEDATGESVEVYNWATGDVEGDTKIVVSLWVGFETKYLIVSEDCPPA